MSPLVAVKLAVEGCNVQRVKVNFIPRLVHRQNSCCFETCPAATYWLDPPELGASHGITPSHKLGYVTNICVRETSSNAGSC